MTMTDTRPEAEATTVAEAPAPELGGLAGYLTTVDHKRLGRMWIVASLVFLVVAGVLGELVAVERFDTDGVDILGDGFTQAYSLHAVGAVFLFLLPLFLGVATYVVPLQVGARAIAFPRAAAAGMWVWLIAGLVFLASYLADGGPGGGDPDAVDLWILSFAALVAGLLVATVAVLATALALRAPGVTLARTPAYSWATLTGGAMLMVTLPLLLVNLVLVFIDHHYGQTFVGGSSGTIGPLLWVFRQPTVYVLALPALGLAAEAVPVFARSRYVRFGLVQGAIAVVAVLGFGAFAQQGLTEELADVNESALFIGMSVLVLAPLLLLLALAGDAIRRGDPRLDSPLLFGVGALLLFLAGAAAGAAAVIEPFDLDGTTWESAQMHLVLLGGGGLGAFGALHYWSPKLWGRRMAEGPAKLTFLLVFLGAVLLAVPDLVSGALDQPLGQAAFEAEDGVEPLNILAAIGGGLVILGAVVYLLGLLGLSRREAAGDDPWNGHTLEWATTSPPPAGNFAGNLPDVTSESPLLDATTSPSTSEVSA
jgi:heme/copper-type cytochrome/quinol oxidase subunit 1